MCRITKQRDAIEAPLRQRVDIGHGVLIDRVSRVDQRWDIQPIETPGLRMLCNVEWINAPVPISKFGRDACAVRQWPYHQPVQGMRVYRIDHDPLLFIADDNHRTSVKKR